MFQHGHRETGANGRAKSRLSRSSSVAATMACVGILLGLRVTRRWNQTGQKLAGEPDIARTFFYDHNLYMCVAVLVTYLDLARRTSWGRLGGLASFELSSIVSITLGLAAIVFKIAFTNAEAPELLRGLPRPLLDQFLTPSLLIQARTVFLGIFGVLAYILISHWKKTKSLSSSSSSSSSSSPDKRQGGK